MSLFDVIHAACERRGLSDELCVDIASEVESLVGDYMIPMPIPGGAYLDAITPLGCPINEYFRPVTKWKLGKTGKATACRDDVATALKTQFNGDPMIGRVAVRVDTWPNNHHAAKEADNDAYAKSVLDSLQDMGAVTDDKQIDYTILHRMQSKVKGGQHRIVAYEY